MKKIIITIIISLSILSLSAQSQDIEDTTILTQRVETLEKQVSYLTLYNELTSFVYEIEITLNKINIETLGIELNTHKFSCYQFVYDQYLENFELNKRLFKACDMRLDFVKKLVGTQTNKYEFSEREIKDIQHYLTKIELLIESFEQNLELMSVALKNYNDKI